MKTDRSFYLFLFIICLTGGILGYFAGKSNPIYHQIIITLESSTPVDTQLFYDTGKGFNENDSIKQVVYQTNTPVILDFSLQGWNIRALRFDPSRSAAKMKIHEIIVRYKGEKPFLVPLDSLKAAKDIRSLDFEGKTVTIEMTETAEDPVLLFSQIGPAPRLTPYKIIVWILTGVIIAFGMGLFIIYSRYLRHRVELTIYNSEILRESIHVCKRLHLFHLLTLTIFLYISFYLSFADYYIDWDMQRYLVQVQIDQCGSGGFSYMHNLINTWIFLGAKFVGFFCGEINTLSSVKILTMLFAWGSSALIYLCIYRLTKNILFAIMGGVAWFFIPGNTLLILTLEDNVWANFFNVLYIFLVLLLSDYISSENNTFSRRIGYSVIIGLCLSIGINIHQQLVPLVYIYPVLVWISHRFTAIQTVIMTCFMLTGYFVGSFSQNYATFYEFAVTGIFQRLWHQPYIEGFRNLWYFSSGKSPGEWIDLILVGLNQSFFKSVISAPKVFYIVICLALLGFFLHVFRKDKRNGLWQNETNVLLIILFTLIFIHIPHSLFYEPWIVERWDATFPGLIIIICYLAYLCITLIQSYLEYIFEFKTGMVLSIICFAIFLFSLGNAKTEINKLLLYHRNQPSVVSLHQTISFIKNRQIIFDKYSYIFLDPIFQEYDNQALISYYYPSANIITLNDNLDILYTSDHFHHIDDHNKNNLRNIKFPDNSKIFAMDRPRNWLNEHFPELLKKHEVIQIN